MIPVCLLASVQHRNFNILADLLTWSAQQDGVHFVIHYLNDFLTVGPPNSETCQQNLDILMHLAMW